MKKALNKTTYLSISMVALFVGLMIAMQFRTNSSVEQAVPIDRVQELTIEKKQVERDLNQLKEESVDLQIKLAEAGKSHTAATGALESELFKNKLYGGLVPVEGQGVEVLLDNQEGSFYNIKDDDLLKVLNDLRGAGAEAIAVNDQRILATSEVRLAGSHINVNLTRLSPPYKVVAIGPSGTLKSSLEIRGGLTEYLSDLGVSVTVQSKDRVLVPAYTGSLRFDYAKHTQR
ncbi:hypothetical protein Psfp_00113 [Pelotomaculum sp. FP]|uniref:DUF881 domain-containing protein n=1 Tax=Pelotomaculum sp. FP TaxID=261474 RepID=UPI0011055F4E|nr:DUF881 domain-containing protein [Pelotomaculum sp. FP]TEB17990.1 hypothetical protein Psfp_00113 [Pelotomaculum sp. FP]